MTITTSSGGSYLSCAFTFSHNERQHIFSAWNPSSGEAFRLKIEGQRVERKTWRRYGDRDEEQ